MPPQLVVLAIAGAGLYAGYKLIGRVKGAVQEELRKAEEKIRHASQDAVNAPRDLGALVYDEKTGTYVPRGDKG